ncbi:BRCT domain-containing protein [Rutstroemia sp. NJR-2017a BBW]|nr:BRCT domain-containing protein [Rutstroemia sp. NJR-2017a BBW]
MDSPTRDHDDAPTGENAVQDHSAPLKGVIMCCTSVPDEKRTALASMAEQMGAAIRADLTVEVTHLIVGDFDTPKYQYVAQFRPDVRPMTLRWIEAVRELWIADQEIDVEALEREHALPTFTGLKVSLTGCEDATERSEIAEKIKENGGIYDGNLTKSVTHLISFRTEGNKYKAAKNWGLRIVSVEWLNDSLERGMILHEQYYDPALPQEERGKGAWDKDKPRLNPSKKRARGKSLAGDEGKKKLRRTASSKLSTQSQSLWGDIVGGGNVIQVSRSGVWGNTASPLPLQDNQPVESGEDTPKPAPPYAPSEPEPPKYGIFGNCCFLNYNFSAKHTRILTNHLLAHDGEVLQSDKDLIESSVESPLKRHFMIVPYDLPANKYPELPESGSQIEIITDWWVERCLHHKQFMEPSTHVIGRPFPSFPIEGFGDLNISSAAFSGIELLHVKKATNLLGGKYSEDMTPLSSVLVTKSIVSLRKDKLEHAQEWKIPIVTADWLWDSITGGTRLPFGKYRCRAARQPASAPAVNKESHGGGFNDSEKTNTSFKTPHSRSSTLPSRSGSKPPRIPDLDNTAFERETPDQPMKDEQDSVPQPIPTAADISTPPPSRPEPLAELHPNSPTKTHNSADSSTTHHSTTQSLPKEEPDPNHAAITDLLAKTRRPSAAESLAHKRQRQPRTKIMGRAMSNVSTASSVDSTATTGNPVQYPEEHPEVDAVMNLDGDRYGEKRDVLPPSTQLGYEDPESDEYRLRVRAIMEGKEGEPVHLPRVMKERSATIGDFVALKGPATRTRGRERADGSSTSRGLR